MSIEFRNVTKILSKPRLKTVVFEEMSAAVPEDRITGILARPTEGKTTLIHLATGSLEPNRGTVRRQARLSYIVGSGRVFSAPLTVRENLVFISRLFGFDPKPIIRFIAEVTEIGKSMDTTFRLLDREQRAKIVFTTSYALPFDTYMVDQSMIGGRGDFRTLCEELVEDRMKSAGFVICTSSPMVLKRYCDTFFIIEDRTLRRVDSVDEAIERLGSSGLRNDDGSSDDAGDDMSSE